MPAALHSLLLRQLRKLGLASGQAPSALAFDALLERISQAYAEVDQERYVLERSQDIATREMAELNRELQVSQARLASLVSLSSDWVWEIDAQGRFVFVSDELERRTALNRLDLLGRRLGTQAELRLTPQDRARLNDAMAACQPFHQITFEVDAADGQCHHMSISGNPQRSGTQLLGYRGVGTDVTTAVLADRQIQRLARYDTLTGLPNRYQFMEELDRALARNKRYERRFALLFIDLDRFKHVNDNLGHAAGDELLRVVGARLQGLLRDADMVGRLGGDEFVVLTESNCDPATLSKIASRIIAVVAEPLQLEGRSVQISASVGICVYPSDGADAASLLKSADTAMYQAKALGKNTFSFYTAELVERAALHFALEGELRVAADRGQLVLHYQPQVDALTGEWVGLEALLRWQHPERGLLAPGLFIELAEESGLIVPIGRWVLHAACQQIAQWRAAGLVPPRCAVNVSARQLGGNVLLVDVERALHEAGIEPQALEIEVTESVLMADIDNARQVLEALDRRGVHIAIDDFGTGYSSLSYLKQVPARTLKIDRAFVSDLPGDEDDLAITRAVVAVGHSLGMQVVAEGVETAAQHVCLSQLGCDVLQGYRFGRPEPAAQIEARLRRLVPLAPVTLVDTARGAPATRVAANAARCALPVRAVDADAAPTRGDTLSSASKSTLRSLP
jgi:diguanylate cyclase (GGDEF)-like protein/PAS domain S-box-containing protein